MAIAELELMQLGGSFDGAGDELFKLAQSVSTNDGASTATVKHSKHRELKPGRSELAVRSGDGVNLPTSQPEADSTGEHPISLPCHVWS